MREESGPTTLCDLIQHLRANVPRYRGCGADFEQLPVVTRSELICERRNFISEAHGIDAAALARFMSEAPVGALETAFRADIVVERTSGSSGLPLSIPKTKEERLVAAQSIWRSRRRYDPEACVRHYLPLVNAPSPAARLGFKYENEETCRPFWRHIAHAGTRWIHATPLILRRLARACATRCAKDALQFAESTGQSLSRNDCELIAQQLRVRVVNQYACREVWVIGHAAGMDDFEILDDNVYVETLDAQGNPVGDGVDGRVIVTSRYQRLFPFVRYDTGDRGKLYTDEHGHRRLALSEHRPHEVLLGASVAQSGVAAFKPLLKHVYAEIGHIDISYLQIFQKSDRCFVVLMPPHPQAEQVRARLETHFNRRGLMPGAASFELLLLSPAAIAAARSSPKFSLFTNAAPPALHGAISASLTSAPLA